MENINDFLSRAAEKSGFIRESYSSNVNVYNPLVIPFFGDRRHEFFLSAFLHDKFKDRYLIIAGFPGRGGLFPKANEYWAIKDEGTISSISKESLGWISESPKTAYLEKQLARFIDIISYEELESYYNFGLKARFIEKYEPLTVELPGIPSLRTDIASRLPVGKKVLVIPNKFIVVIRHGKPVRIEANPKSYIMIVEKLFENGTIPIVIQSSNSYDISAAIGGRYPVFYKLKALEELSLARSCDCVLDLFAGDSRLAILARTPYLSISERLTFDNFKDYEVEDLAGSNIPNKHIFSFATMIERNEYKSVVDGIQIKLKEFLPTLNENELPSTSHTSFSAPYMLVRERKMKKFGHRLFRLPKIED